MRQQRKTLQNSYSSAYMNKKAFVPYMFLFFGVLLSAILIPLSHLQAEEIKNSSLYLESLKINSKFNVMENKLELAILQSNALIQSQLTQSFISQGVDAQVYDERLNEDIERRIETFNKLQYFSSQEYSINELFLEIQLQETSGQLSITRNITLEKNKYKDEFFTQITTLRDIDSQISTIQGQVDTCYASSFNENSCADEVMDSIEQSHESVRCDQEGFSGLEGINCFFTTAPYTGFTYEGLEQIQRQDDIREIEVSSSIVRYNRENILKIFSNQLPFDDGQREYEFIMFFIPDENYDIETAINTFESIIINEETDASGGILNGIEENRINNNDILGLYLTKVNQGSDGVQEAIYSTYEAQIEGIDLYFKIVTKNSVDSVELQPISDFFEFSQTPRSVFIINNRYFEDVSMYERGVEEVIPRPEDSDNT
ncbi:MAG: hypothetical protein ACLFPL_02455 [Candidatus Nanoarchaeia archaeon]